MDVAALSKERAQLLAIRLASLGAYDDLEIVFEAHSYTLPAVLGILLYYVPETAPPKGYVAVIAHHLDSIASTGEFTHSRLLRQIQKRPQSRIEAELSEQFDVQPSVDDLSAWFIQRARRIDVETGQVDLARQLILGNDNIAPSAALEWAKGILQVFENLIRVSPRMQNISLAEFEESTQPNTMLDGFFSSTTLAIQQSLDSLVVPYFTYLNTWEPVWLWLLAKAQTSDLGFVRSIVTVWPSPTQSIEVREQFFRTCVGACYICHSTTAKTWENMRQIHTHLVKVYPEHKLDKQSILESRDIDAIEIPDFELGANKLISETSTLTKPSAATLHQLDLLIASASLFTQYNVNPPLSLGDLLLIRRKDKEIQLELANKLVRSDPAWKTRNDDSWRKLRDAARWLKFKSSVFGKLHIDEIESVVLAGLFAAARKLRVVLRTC